MKITGILFHKLYDHCHMELNFPLEAVSEIEAKLEALGKVDPDKEYDITIEPRRKKRSRNANAYMWVLADKIAEKTQTTKEDVYREAIRRVGVFEDMSDIFKDVAVVDEAADWLVASWAKNGIGWFAEKYDSRLKDCTKVRLYVGSSTYDTKEMSRLIDEIVEEAKYLGIETATPDEIARMKSTWGQR